jgi:6-phosphogluconolactonase
MSLIYKPDRKSLNSLAAGILIRETRRLLGEKEFVVWALPGGRSVGQIYDILSSRDSLDWSRIHFFMTDERFVPIENHNSNFNLVMKRLLYHLLSAKSITGKNIHPFVYRPGKRDKGLDIYRQELEKFQDNYDIVLLSSGGDCHIAGLFPEHGTIRDNSDFYIKTIDSPKRPPERMSSSRKLLLRSGTALLLFYGEEKELAYKSFLDMNNSIEKCPARLVLEIENNYILTDQKI